MKILRIAFYFLLIVCIHGCILFNKSKSDETNDEPLVYKTDYKIKKYEDVKISKDSAALRVTVCDKRSNSPMQYVGIEIQSLLIGGFTSEDGNYMTMVPAGTYNIRIIESSALEIKSLRLKGGSIYELKCNLGTSIWY
jgi:hypothetical protein